MITALSFIQASSPGVIITIAREHGTAGKQIGQLVAEKMNIPCYYKEMTAIAAKESGLASEFISNINSVENAVMRELYLSTNVMLYLAMMDFTKKWTGHRQDWCQIRSQLENYFEERLSFRHL